jgi:hypothetical protein
MSELWSKVQGLTGQTLMTDSRGKKFQIVSVSADWVTLVPKEGNGTPRPIRRADLEAVSRLNLGMNELTPSRIQEELPGTRNSSYIAAILAACR